MVEQFDVPAYDPATGEAYDVPTARALACANDNTHASAADLARRAADLVSVDRDRQHGAKAENFARIATLWNAYLQIRREPAEPLDAVDVGHMMVLLKQARTQSGAYNQDDYVDMIGYSACAGEIARVAA